MAQKRSPERGFPRQHQTTVPGREAPMTPQPLEKAEWYRGSGKLRDKVALITGGDSGIGRSVAILFAREGARISVVYCNEHEDAETTRRLVEAEGSRCLLIAGELGDASFCREAVRKTVDEFGGLDVLVNNAGFMAYQKDLENLDDRQLEHTFRTNIFSYFYMTRAALPHLKSGSAIINTSSVTAYKGSAHLLDYSATKGAIISFTRSLSQALAGKGIRVNAVAPGPVWTPLIPSSYSADQVTMFGTNVPMRRAGQPEEIAPCYVFLAARDSSYMTGQVLHPNGGTIVNG